ncbi:MDR family oxidoreductase [Candidatus Poriferisocius sp.]|uniref:acrylyl-CoA reductase (NADPH) n=1 Tax=Candidatus Poriferisocius sp. TaxID=3101276 RepID=UPI003B02536D
MFRALLLSQDDDGNRSHAITELDDAALPDRPVLVAVDYSTLNYKDGLAILNGAPIVRTWPLVPGIDLAGTVARSTDPAWSPGDRVIVNGWDVGESYWGGMATRAALDGGWLTPLPDAYSTHQAMAVGTAGYTAMLCVLALEEHGITPDSGPVVVTGAAGGVGSVAVAVLAQLGYEVVASSGRIDTEGDYLRGLGAAELIHRDEFSEAARPLGRARFAGGIDTVGSHTLANIVSQVQPHGCVTACGLAQGMDFPGSVAPFILRAITLVGINCVHEPAERRAEAWSRLARDLDTTKLDTMTTTIGLADVPAAALQILAGEIRGRVVVDVNH